MALSGQTVISDLDKTLKQLFQSEFGTTLPFDLSFAIPDKNFTPVSKTQTTLDCYLYEINEDRELRSVAPIVQRNIDGTIDKTLPPPRIKLSYCITAWSPAQPTPDGEPQLDGQTAQIEIGTRKKILEDTRVAEHATGKHGHRNGKSQRSSQDY